MRRQHTRFIAWIVLATMVQCGCHPIQPHYLHEDGDLSHYVDVATEIEYPDVDCLTSPEAADAYQPLTVAHPDFEEMWDLTLEECISITLNNSKVFRTFGRVTQVGQITSTVPSSITQTLLAGGAPVSVYDPALVESNPGSLSMGYMNRGPIDTQGKIGPAPPGISFGQPGVEAALSEFDAQLRSSVTWQAGDRDQILFLPGVEPSNNGLGLFEVSKKAANGTVYAARSVTEYSQTPANTGFGANNPTSVWLQALELEARHPLLRGSGTQVNRIPVVLARIRNDISLADFEANSRDLVGDVENAYWELYCAYRVLDARKKARDASLRTWRNTYNKFVLGGRGGGADVEAQTKEQYFRFRASVEEALRDLFKAESRLRYILGIAPTDGRLIRPMDEPTLAQVNFDWCQILQEANIRSPELRMQRWRVKQREMELIAARSTLQPSLDIVALYRWLGQGDDLIEIPRKGINFPQPGSLAWDNLTEGKQQEYFLGLEFQMPLGFRQELAGVRHVELLLAREKAVLEDAEIEVAHQLTDAVQMLEAGYILVQTNFNRYQAAQRRVQVLMAAEQAGHQDIDGRPVIDTLLEAQRFLADAEETYFRSLCNYNLALKEVHQRKNSLLDYDNIVLAEGPWPQKAYWDAMALARQRDASYYMDYGYTRPHVISQGPAPGGPEGGYEGLPDGEYFVPEGAETIEAPQPTPAERGGPAPLPVPESTGMLGPQPTRRPASPTGPSRAAAAPSREVAATSRRSSQEETFYWDDLGLQSASGTGGGR